MTRRHIRAMAARASAALLLGATAAGAGSVYPELASELQALDHRRPGSPAFDQAMEAVSARLRAAGLIPRVQTYSTLVPETERCRLTIDGREVTPVYPCDNGLAPLVTPGEIRGPLVWLGDGSIEAMVGKPVNGCIAVLDLGAPRVRVDAAFTQGARAVVLVGSDAASQWRARNVVFQGPVTVPRVFVPHDAAERAGLLQGDGREAVLDVRVRLRDAVARNLWVEIPGREGARFRLGTEESVLLSAPLATGGLVPDYTPDSRVAANAALLADVMCALAAEKPARSVCAVFLGSHYAAQEGTRYFYYPIAKINSTDVDTLEARAGRYQSELAAVTNLAAMLDRTDLLSAHDAVAIDVVVRLRGKLVGWVNSANAALQDLRLEQQRIERDLRRDVNPERGAETEVRRAELEARIAGVTAQKRGWNLLRKQMGERRSTFDDPEAEPAFRACVAAYRADLNLREAQVRRLIEDNRCFQEIAGRFSGKSVVAHFGFDFADAGQPWLLSVINAAEYVTRKGLDTGSYLMHFVEFGRMYADVAAREPGWQAPLYRDALNPFYKPFSLCVPGQRSVSSTVGVLVGTPGFQMMTVGDPLDADGMPLRRDCNLGALAPQMTSIVRELANREAFSLRSPFPKEYIETRCTYLYENEDRIEGVQSVNYSKGSSEIEGPAMNAVMMIHSPPGEEEPAREPGLSRYPIARVNANGYIFMPTLCRDAVRGYHIGYVFGYDSNGRIERYSVPSEGVNLDRLRIPVFYGYGGGAFSYGFGADMLGASVLQATYRLDARTDSAIKNSQTATMSGIESFVTDKNRRIKFIGSKGELALGSTAGAPGGLGITRDPWALLNYDGIREGAADYWTLNDGRLRVLRERNIINDALETLHAEAGEHLALARELRASPAPDYALAQAHEIAATCLENRAYQPLKGITEDLVRAVIVLLLLNIPFAFAMERLVFGFTSIYKQVVGFVGFFVVTFGVLYVTHPAFSLASAPVIIFLAFVIIMLSSIVVYIVLGKIKQEIKAIQGMASTVHGASGEGGTGLAAVLIGISGMRNRPLKTVLTAVTVVLLTFTILVFASFTSRLGVITTYIGKGEGCNRIELHRFSFLDIPEEMVRAVRQLYASEFHVVRRGGLFRNPTRLADKKSTPLSPDRVVYNPANGKLVGFGAVMGLEPAELKLNAELAPLAPGFADGTWPHPPLFLPASAAERLGVKPGERLKLLGSDFTFAGTLDASVIQNVTMIEGNRIVPPDFENTVKNIGREIAAGGSSGVASPDELEQIDPGSFVWFSPERVAVTDLSTLLNNFGTAAYVNFVTLYPRRPDVRITDWAEKIAPIFQGAVHARSDDGARRYFFSRAVAGSGFGDVLVPLLLGGLIIFSSLMGSIVDREREIFTYSALGLAPPDVGALFFAESAVYSVIGGLGGYLLSQLVAKLLTTLGRLGLFHPPEMNFHSLTSVLTILIVMAVVMLSTIYPAVVAGRSANPGVARRWKMPAPKGDRMEFIFPFTVSNADFAGILSFIKEHFENHGDATLGNFAAKDVQLFKAERPSGGMSLGIRADISLAPFDLGIFQTFRMYSKEFEIKGIEEVVVEMERIGGTPGAWVRGNRTFANELRQQFLLWRSLPIHTVHHYRQQTETLLKTEI